MLHYTDVLNGPYCEGMGVKENERQEGKEEKEGGGTDRLTDRQTETHGPTEIR